MPTTPLNLPSTSLELVLPYISASSMSLAQPLLPSAVREGPEYSIYLLDRWQEASKEEVP